MSENGFATFVPRRLVRNGPAAPAASSVEPAEPEDHRPDTNPAPSAIASTEESCGEPGTTGAAMPTMPDAAALDAAYRERVRTAAIDLAAAACARALHYAVDRNPRLLARFVDDALRAAGDPEHAVVRVAAQSAFVVAEIASHDIVADATLSPGDVFINCAGGTLGATIEERAECLVRALAT